MSNSGKNAMPKACTAGDGIYIFGFLGAAVYYIHASAGFWAGVVGVLKALIWPSFLVFETMKALGI